MVENQNFYPGLKSRVSKCSGLLAFYIVLPILLFGCGKSGNEQTVDFGRGYLPGLTFAMPYKDQDGVSTESRVTLKFTDQIETADLASAITVTRQSTGKSVAGNITQSETDPSILYFEPDNPFYQSEEYQVGIAELATPAGPVQGKKDLYSFSTAGTQSSVFNIARVMPAGKFQFMDFSSINLTLSKNILEHSVVLGKTLEFVETASGQAIPIGLFVRGAHITIDPLDDLDPTKVYRLRLSAGIKSIGGDTLAPFEQSFKPLNSQPRGSLTMKMNTVPLDASEDEWPKSPLTSAPINTVRFASQLLGNNNVTRLSGDMTAEVAYLPNFPEVSPMVLRKGLVFTGTGINVMIGGGVPAQIQSGDIKMVLLSDAQGYMVKSVFSDYRYASNNVHIFMDVALIATNPTVQSMITQNVLHTELIGTIQSIDGKMIFDAAGSVKNDLINIASATSELSFHLETSTKPAEHSTDGAPRQLAAVEPLRVIATYPMLNGGGFLPDNDLAIYFSSVIEETSFVAGKNIKLRMFSPNSSEPQYVDFDMSVEGAVVHIMPKKPLPFNATYAVEIGNTIKDKYRNTLAQDVSLQFATPLFSAEDPRPAYVSSMYPGYPCVMTDVDYPNQIAGRCLGGKKSDDPFNFFPLPANRNIQVHFSQPMDPASIWMSDECDAGSFRVEKIDNQGNCIEAVSGDLIVKHQQLRFTPHTPWQDGISYRYTLMSDDANEECDEEEICSLGDHPLPLNTDPVNYKPGVLGRGIHNDIGGPPLEVAFIGKPPTRFVFSPFKINTTDVNGNGLVDQDETILPENFINMEATGKSGLVTDISLGCTIAERATCPENNKRSFLNGSLYSELKDYIPEQDVVQTDLYPSVFYGTSVFMHAKALLGLLDLKLNTGLIVLRNRGDENDLMPAKIIPGGVDETGKPQFPIFEIVWELYFDTPYLQVLGGLSGTSMHSLPVAVKLRGPVSFMPDGRMQLNVTNPEAMAINVDLYVLEREALETLLGKNILSAAVDAMLKVVTLNPKHKIGSIEITVPKEAVNLHFVGEPFESIQRLN